MALAAVTPPQDWREGRVIGLKLEVSVEILPRDTSLGTKIFMLLPDEAKSVRDVKSYIANSVLKTPVPFHFYMGEYRIRDEEDAKIFSIITEPCRLTPVPPPRSALSSTPKPKSNEKHVTFFDGDLSASPVHGPGPFANGLDVMDHSQGGRSIHSPEVFVAAQSPVVAQQNESNSSDQQVDLSDISTERKKRRRRRHRNSSSKKSKGSSNEDPGCRDDDDEMNESVDAQPSNGCELNSSVSASNVQQQQGCSRASLERNHLEVLNEETESEDETSEGMVQPKEFEFVTPVSTTTSKASRKRADLSEQQPGGKKKKLSDSAFESSCSFLSPVSSSGEDSRINSGKPRQDTPIVPRVTRNSRMFDSARKIIDVYAAGQLPDEGNQNPGKQRRVSSSSNAKSTKVGAEGQEGEDRYKNMKPIGCVDEINLGDLVAFKVLELDERYNPSISSYKEGIVSGKMGTKVNITYTKNATVVRTGRYDLDFAEDSDDLPEGNESKPETAEFHFAELLEPKSISASAHPSASGSSPPSII